MKEMKQKLSQLNIGETANVYKINMNKDEELAIRLIHLGFLENEEVSIIKKTPFTSDALLIAIRGCQIALTKKEADLIEVLTCPIKKLHL